MKVSCTAARSGLEQSHAFQMAYHLPAAHCGGCFGCCRGSMAVGVAYGLHLNLFQTLHWHPADVAVALQSALPVMMLDAVMLLPHYKPSKPSGQQQQVAGATPPAQNAAVHGSSQRAWLLKSALSSVQSHSLRYSLAGVSSRPRSFLLTSAAELSDDLLGRAVIFGMAVDWIQDRY